MRSLFAILIFSLFNTIGYTQETYFNNIYNYNNFSPALAIIEYGNNYIAYGVTYDSLNSSRAVFLLSLDSAGNVNYWKTVSEPYKSYWAGYRGVGLDVVENRGFIGVGCVTDSIRTNAILYRFDSSGDTLYTKEYPDTIYNMYTQFWDCDTANDGGFIMAGNHTVDSYTANVFIVKADSLGNEKWRQEYGNQGLISGGYSVVQTPDNGYLLGCYRYVSGSNNTGDPFLLKVDSIGNLEWEKWIGGQNGDSFTQVCLGNDGSYIAGTTLSDSVTAGGNKYSRPKIYKLDHNGEIIWEKQYTSTELYNKLYSIYPDHNGGYIAVGRRNNSTHPGIWWNEYGWLLKIDEDGDSVWYREYQYFSGTGDDYNDLYDVCLAPDGGYAMVGQAKTWGTPQVAWVIKVDSMGCDTPGCSTGVGIEYHWRPETGDRNLYIFPNPASEIVYIKHQISDISYQLSIYDLYGRKQDEIIIPKGQEQTRVDISGYPAGVYIVILKDEKGVVARGKFIISGNR